MNKKKIPGRITTTSRDLMEVAIEREQEELRRRVARERKATLEKLEKARRAYEERQLREQGGNSTTDTSNVDDHEQQDATSTTSTPEDGETDSPENTGSEWNGGKPWFGEMR